MDSLDRGRRLPVAVRSGASAAQLPAALKTAQRAQIHERHAIGSPAQTAIKSESMAGTRLGSWLSDYAFIVRTDDDIACLLNARRQAEYWGVTFHAALFCDVRITPECYATALAASLAVPLATSEVVLAAIRSAGATQIQTLSPKSARGLWRGDPVTFICCTDAEPSEVRGRLLNAIIADSAIPAVLVCGSVLAAAEERALSAAALKSATYHLKRHSPAFSAGRRGPEWQPLIAAAVFGLAIGGIVVLPSVTVAATSVLLVVPFLGIVLVRLVAIGELFRAPPKTPLRMADRDLPTYTIMVALYDEAPILPDLIAGLSRLDYPLPKIEVFVVIEDTDSATKLALMNLQLPAFVRVIIVPEGEPRTKPRALNYALSFATGDYVVIYDAEDRPEPDQLRRAAIAFANGSPDLACVQACLNIFNARQSWLTRQFTVEYSSLFDSLLPALQRLRLPMPLGGTSNHFPRAVLTGMGGWDPYNVTEDADLGIRIARLGRSTAMIGSTTWEEAPATLGQWLRQRTRWLKGWMQTYLVHTRKPSDLRRELGLSRTLGFHLYLGGLILSSLVHPVFYLALLVDWAFALRSSAFDDSIGPIVGAIALANLVLGYLAAIVVGVVSVRRRGHRLTLSALFMPLYWLLISVAAYRALWQLYQDPHLWEKTPHGMSEED